MVGSRTLGLGGLFLLVMDVDDALISGLGRGPG